VIVLADDNTLVREWVRALVAMQDDVRVCAEPAGCGGGSSARRGEYDPMWYCSRETGWTDGRTAAAMAELMTWLGYGRYGVHGGAFVAVTSGALFAAFLGGYP
jgi:hypothetical protein